LKQVAIVLAAGAGRRFGGGKLAAPFRGEPLLAHALRAACASPAERVLVVAAPGLDCGDTGRAEVLRLASCSLSATLRAGIAAAGPCDGAFVFLGDMPLVPHDMALRLAESIGQAYAAQPRFAGRPGHPVLLSARAMADALARLEGDEGMGRLLRGRSDVVFVESDDPGVCLDVDIPEDVDRLGGDQP
jgi:molybdenum cofactor cytidylyltransferase